MATFVKVALDLHHYMRHDSGEIRTRGLLVPNRRLRPTVFGSILALSSESGASLLTHCCEHETFRWAIDGHGAARVHA